MQLLIRLGDLLACRVYGWRPLRRGPVIAIDAIADPCLKAILDAPAYPANPRDTGLSREFFGTLPLPRHPGIGSNGDRRLRRSARRTLDAILRGRRGCGGQCKQEGDVTHRSSTHQMVTGA